MVVEKNGAFIATAATVAVMGNPGQSVAWLVNKLAEVELALDEGEMVLAGALTGAMQMTDDDVLQSDLWRKNRGSWGQICLTHMPALRPTHRGRNAQPYTPLMRSWTGVSVRDSPPDGVSPVLLVVSSSPVSP